MKKCSTQLVISKMRIEITMSYLNTPTRMAKMRKTDKAKCGQGGGVFETPLLLCSVHPSMTMLSGRRQTRKGMYGLSGFFIESIKMGNTN